MTTTENGTTTNRMRVYSDSSLLLTNKRNLLPVSSMNSYIFSGWDRLDLTGLGLRLSTIEFSPIQLHGCIKEQKEKKKTRFAGGVELKEGWGGVNAFAMETKRSW